MELPSIPPPTDTSPSTSPNSSESGGSSASTGRTRADTISPTSPTGERRPSISRRSSRSLSFEIWDKIPEEVLLPRSEWLAKVMQKHPEFLELRERTRNILGTPSFGRAVYNVGKTEAKETLSHNVVLGLMYQFLKEERLLQTIKVLEDESGVKFFETDLDEKAMFQLLSMSIRDMDSIFSDGAYSQPEEDPEVPAHEDYNAPDSEGIDTEDYVPIWEEPPDSPDNIVIYDMMIEAGTLNKLVQWLFVGGTHDKDYRRFFLLSYRSFTTPERLLTKLIQLYSSPPKAYDQNTTFQVVSFLKYWLEQQPTDFSSSERLLMFLNSFIDNRMVRDRHFHLVKQLRNLISKVEAQAASEPTPTTDRRVERAPEPKVPRNIFSPKLALDDIDEEEIARQLTLIEFKYFFAIRPAELFNKLWTKRKQHLERSPNITAMLNRFTEVSRWVATEILTSIKPKSLVVGRFIKIAEYLFKLNNYQSLKAIHAGLTCSSVSKVMPYIKRDLPKPQHEILRELSILLGSENSYQNYRDAISASQPPCLPYVGILLRDLTFFEEAYPDKFKSMINFAKRRYQCELIIDTLKYQVVPYNYHAVHQISSLLEPLQYGDENDLHIIANGIEQSYESS